MSNPPDPRKNGAPGNEGSDRPAGSLLEATVRKSNLVNLWLVRQGEEQGNEPDRLPDRSASPLPRTGSGGTDPVSWPSGGEEWFGFRLREELGRGSFARVFLATQLDLAGRPVVLKISRIHGNEPYTLAQLQHTHIVPIHSLHEDAATGLRMVCMPYFGGAGLDRVLRVLWGPGTSPPERGEQLMQALAEVSPKDEGPHRLERPAPALQRSSYVNAVVWMAARLAEALHHAHERGILHRDIKPSNILLTADGQPMLLDFNLSASPSHDSADVPGGTLVYMAPEQLNALRSPGPGGDPAADHRADLYALGLVLHEMLTGRLPQAVRSSAGPLSSVVAALADKRSRPVPSLRSLRPELPRGLESIVRTCLAPNPADRYQQAEHLAKDLRRFLTDQPLKHAPELSRTEQVRKWVRRHPRLTSVGSVVTAAVVLLVAVGTALVGVRTHLQAALDRERSQTYRTGTARALCLVNTTSPVHDHLPQAITICRDTLNLFEVLDRADWQHTAAWVRQPEATRRHLAEDTRELLVMLAWAEVRRAPGDRGVLEQGLVLLDRADAVEGLKPSPAVRRARAGYRKQLGDGTGAAGAERAAPIAPVSAGDHYLLAATFLLERNPRDPVGHAEATKAVLKELNEAVRLNPRHYGSWILRGICHQEQGEHTLAAADFSTCIGLWPEFSWGYFNRACALAMSGQPLEALDDYTAALACDPDMQDACWNRGLVLQQLERYRPALADFEQAARLGRDDAYLYVQRGLALERLGRPEEADAAFQKASARAGAAEARVRSEVRWWYGFAVHRRLPDRAREAFEKVLEESPEHPQALYGLGMLAAEQGKLDRAVGFFHRAVAANPSFVEARRFRAVLLARAGQMEQAQNDINWCLEKEPRSGVTLYAAACLCALAPADSRVDTTEQALAFLQRAFAQGYGQDKAAGDPDLAGLRDHPKFRQVVGKELGAERP
jgi:serine/threonine protein kinase/tetratricopeptide (TPR) repeat protein